MASKFVKMLNFTQILGAQSTWLWPFMLFPLANQQAAWTQPLQVSLAGSSLLRPLQPNLFTQGLEKWLQLFPVAYFPFLFLAVIRWVLMAVVWLCCILWLFWQCCFILSFPSCTPDTGSWAAGSRNRSYPDVLVLCGTRGAQTPASYLWNSLWCRGVSLLINVLPKGDCRQ